MSLTHLLNRPCTITHRSKGTEKDRYGNEVMAEATTETFCEIQQSRRSLSGRTSEPDAGGDLSDTNWTGIFLPGTLIGSADTVTSEGESFEVVGEPWQARNPRTSTLSHVEAPLRRTAAPEEA